MLTGILISLISVSQFTMVEGLSQNTVFSITQDSERNMWFATYDGVNRFDGYNFRQYHPDRDPEFVQVEGADQKVFADSRGQIWAYYGGLSRYDRQSDSFISLRNGVNGPVTDFLELPGDRLLLAVDGKIVALDLVSAEQLELPERLSIQSASVLDYGGGMLAVGTTSGEVLVYDAESYEMVSSTVAFSGRAVHDISFSSQGEVWAAGNGVVRIDPSRGEIISRYTRSGGNLPPDFSMIICQDRQERIILGTRSGIYAYDRVSDTFVLSFLLSFPMITLRSMYMDADGDLWLGSFYRGVLYCHEEDTPFENISLEVPVEDLQIASINESPSGQVWISTLKKGIFVYDPVNGSASHVIMPQVLENTGIMKILFSPDGSRLWIGFSGGLAEYEPRTGRFHHYTGSGYPRAVYSIVPATEGKLWLGTLSGLYLFDCIARKAEKIEGSEDLFVYKIYIEDGRILWVASESGLYRSDLEYDRTGRISCGPFVRETGAMDVHDVLSFGEGSLAVAARNGLFLRDKDGIWTHFDKSSGLSSNFINSIESDFSGFLWIGTEYGLNRFDPVMRDVTRFFRDDGPGLEYYTKNSHCLAHDGSLYFGGLGGLVRVDPVFRKPVLVSSDPIITEFVVNGVSRPMSSVKLAYDDNSIGFKFSVTNYSSRQKDIFRYRLHGVDTEWRTTDKPFSDNYASLRPGRYRLELNSFNRSGVKSKNSAVFEFVILPPWWAGTVAIVVYLVLAVTAVGLVIWRIYKYSRDRAQKEIDRIKAFSQAGMDRLTVLRFTGDPVSSEDADFILKAVRIMEQNISNEEFGVEQLADEMCMSRSNLYIRIKKLTGNSVLRFVHKVRLDKACELLNETDMSIAEIACDTGFGSSAYFCTCFKREKGISPNRWRN